MNQKLIEAIKNPPPERLAKIEYQSHFLQGIGISAVCIALIYKGLWYIIFAFIFGVGISYSQGMTAYMKYKAIKSFRPQEKAEDFEKDISTTRRRSKIVNSVFGGWAGKITMVVSVIGTILLINPNISRWWLMVLYPITIIAVYVIVYFFIMYWIAYPIYKKRCKEVQNGQDNSKRT